MAWSWVPTVVVADAPNGPLSQELRVEQQQGRFGGGAPQAPNWIWLSEAEDLQDAARASPNALGAMDTQYPESASMASKGMPCLVLADRPLRR